MTAPGTAAVRMEDGLLGLGSFEEERGSASGTGSGVRGGGSGLGGWVLPIGTVGSQEGGEGRGGKEVCRFRSGRLGFEVPVGR